jgi:metal-responsive CopG/Arc/MetJ family transcriptional regulator
MKTIAISIDEPTLKAVERALHGAEGRFPTRSALIRQATAEYLRRLEREQEADRETKIFRQQHEHLRKCAEHLVTEQAGP